MAQILYAGMPIGTERCDMCLGHRFPPGTVLKPAWRDVLCCCYAGNSIATIEIGACEDCRKDRLPCNSSICAFLPAHPAQEAIAQAHGVPLMEIRVKAGQDAAPMVTISRTEHLRLLAIEEASNTLYQDRKNLEIHFQDLAQLLKGATKK